MEFRLNTKMNQEIVINAVNAINENIVDVNLDNLPIILSDNISVSDIYNDGGLLSKAYENGFGAVIANIRIDSGFKHLVVLNFEIINALSLKPIEIQGVVSHELGHLLNKYEEEYVPTYLDISLGKASKEDMERLKISNRDNKEIYADHYSKACKTSDGLISSMNKYINSKYCVDRDKDLFKPALCNRVSLFEIIA